MLGTGQIGRADGQCRVPAAAHWIFSTSIRSAGIVLVRGSTASLLFPRRAGRDRIPRSSRRAAASSPRSCGPPAQDPGQARQGGPWRCSPSPQAPAMVHSLREGGRFQSYQHALSPCMAVQEEWLLTAVI
mmetsp:Transcript_79456/g.233528  ORF Transcript_79456/g.233528 Transcript_79456/m.233528 type:complete len:130 (+) Transcript_79456:752-1141(+)